jgi:hypothetical protein
MVVQLAEGDDVPTVPHRADEMEDEGKEAGHLFLLFIFPVVWK